MDVILRKNFVFLRHNLRLKEEFLAYMFQEHLIDYEEYEHMQDEAKSERERVRYFIMTAMRGKTKSDLRRLIQMLRKTNQEPVAHRLERANVRKKKLSKPIRLRRTTPSFSNLVVFLIVHKSCWRMYQANKPHVEKVLKIIFGKRPEIKEGIMPENSNSNTSDPSKNHTLEIKERVKLRFYFPNLPKDTYKIVEEGLRSSLSLSLDLPRDLLEVFAKPFSSVLVIVILPGAAALKLFSILSKPLPNFLYEKYGPTRLKIETLRPMTILFEKAFEQNWGSRAWIRGQVARLNECSKNFHQLKTQLSYWLPPPWWQKAAKNRFRKFQSQLDHVQDQMQALKDSFSKLILLPKPQAVEVSTQTEFRKDDGRWSETIRFRESFSPQSGFALIINTVSPESELHSQAQSETNSLLSTFKKLGLVCETETSVKSGDVSNTLENFGNCDYAKYDWLVCCLLVAMEKMKTGRDSAEDCSPLYLHDIMAPFNESTCPSLSGKPRVFIIIAPAGRSIDETGDMHAKFEDDKWTLREGYVPKDCLLLVFHYPAPEDKGSSFATSLLDNLKQQGGQLNDVEELLFMAYDQLIDSLPWSSVWTKNRLSKAIEVALET